VTVHLVGIEYNGPFIVVLAHHVQHNLVDEILIKSILRIDHNWDIVVKGSFAQLVDAGTKFFTLLYNLFIGV